MVVSKLMMTGKKGQNKISLSFPFFPTIYADYVLKLFSIKIEVIMKKFLFWFSGILCVALFLAFTTNNSPNVNFVTGETYRTSSNIKINEHIQPAILKISDTLLLSEENEGATGCIVCNEVNNAASYQWYVASGDKWIALNETSPKLEFEITSGTSYYKVIAKSEDGLDLAMSNVCKVYCGK